MGAILPCCGADDRKADQDQLIKDVTIAKPESRKNTETSDHNEMAMVEANNHETDFIKEQSPFAA